MEPPYLSSPIPNAANPKSNRPRLLEVRILFRQIQPRAATNRCLVGLQYCRKTLFELMQSLYQLQRTGTSGLECAESSPVLVYIHIPKTGGMSILNWLQQAGSAYLNLFVNNTHFVYSEETLAQTLMTNPGVKFLSSHFILTFPPLLAGRRMLYFTLLRDPVEQFISYLTFIKRVYATLTDPNLLSCLPPDPCSMSTREFAGWLLSQNREDIPFRENYTTDRLARQTYISLHSPAAIDHTVYRAARLSLAKAVLDQFMFVGLTEKMEESIDRLRMIAGLRGLELPTGPLGVENVSNQLRDDLSWIHPEDQVGAMLLRSLEEDRQLYDWAVERFEARDWSKRVSISR